MLTPLNWSLLIIYLLIFKRDFFKYFSQKRYFFPLTPENLVCAQKDHFRCSPSFCIHKHQVCNGVKDCKNGADEVGCGKFKHIDLLSNKYAFVFHSYHIYHKAGLFGITMKNNLENSFETFHATKHFVKPKI